MIFLKHQTIIKTADVAELSQLYRMNIHEVDRNRIESGRIQSVTSKKIEVNTSLGSNNGGIEWADIDLPNSVGLPSQAVIGKGSFGIVVKAVWNQPVYARGSPTRATNNFRSPTSSNSNSMLSKFSRRFSLEVNSKKPNEANDVVWRWL
jgi:hypothetical protein